MRTKFRPISAESESGNSCVQLILTSQGPFTAASYKHITTVTATVAVAIIITIITTIVIDTVRDKAMICLDLRIYLRYLVNLEMKWHKRKYLQETNR